MPGPSVAPRGPQLGPAGPQSRKSGPGTGGARPVPERRDAVNGRGMGYDAGEEGNMGADRGTEAGVGDEAVHHGIVGGPL